MTCGEIYELNKIIYNKEAENYIKKYLPKIGDIAYIPFVMKTHYSRGVVKRISKDKFIWFSAILKNIKHLKNGINIKYEDEQLRKSEININQLIRSFGFEISINPNSKANRDIMESVKNRGNDD